MPVEVFEGSERLRWVGYPGTGGAAVAAALGATFVSESGGVLSMNLNGDAWTVPSGSWMVQVYDVGTAAWQAWSLVSASDLAKRVIEVSAPVAPTIRQGAAAVGPLLLNTSATVGVQLSSAMPSAAYAADAVVWTGASLLGALEVTAVSVVDADTVNVTVHNGGLVTLSGSILVTAVG